MGVDLTAGMGWVKPQILIEKKSKKQKKNFCRKIPWKGGRGWEKKKEIQVFLMQPFTLPSKSEWLPRRVTGTRE